MQHPKRGSSHPSRPTLQKKAFADKRQQTRSFAELLLNQANQSGFPVLWQTPEPFATTDYSAEVLCKNKAFASFWELHRLPRTPEPIIPSLKPRHYRTTTKRRVFFKRNKIQLSLSQDLDYDYDSLLEPKEHAAIYRTIYNSLNTPVYEMAGKKLNYVIIRGSYTEQIIVFNAHTLNGEIVRKLRLLAEKIQRTIPSVVAAFIYFDPSRSDYYLESEKPSNNFQLKKISGYNGFKVVVNDLKFLVPPTSFSQVNESLVPKMVTVLREVLLAGKKQRLIDLFCGYGVFSHALGNDYKEITGIDSMHESITAAQVSAEHIPHKAKMSFKLQLISNDNFLSMLPRHSPAIAEDVILDPPRNGIEEKTIEAIASRKPERIVHIFCGIEEIPKSVKAWERNGYAVERVIPFDLFAGTASVETMVVLVPIQTHPQSLS